MKEEALSLYIPEDMEADMKLHGVLANSWGNGISAAIIWTAETCEDLDALVTSQADLQRARRALTPCRRTSAVLTPPAYQMLRDMCPGDMPMARVVKAVLRYFIDNCQDIPAALLRAAIPSARPKSIPSMRVPFDYDTFQRIRIIAAQVALPEHEVVLDIVKRALDQGKGGAAE